MIVSAFKCDPTLDEDAVEDFAKKWKKNMTGPHGQQIRVKGLHGKRLMQEKQRRKSNEIDKNISYYFNCIEYLLDDRWI